MFVGKKNLTLPLDGGGMVRENGAKGRRMDLEEYEELIGQTLSEFN